MQAQVNTTNRGLYIHPHSDANPPRDDAISMWETPVPAVPAALHRPMTPCIPLPRTQDSSSSLSTMSAPLFTEDRCSSISDDDVEVCNAEVTLINRQNRPNQTFTTHSTEGRPTSMPSTMDYITQGDPNQITPPTYINTAQTIAQNQFFRTSNFSFQTVATGAFTRLEIRFSMPDTWRTEIIHTY